MSSGWICRLYSCRWLQSAFSISLPKHAYHESISSFHSNFRFMAGHSKWQNIRHIKAAKDKEKSFFCDKYSRLVRASVRDRGPDPKLNRSLADLLDEARKHNVPSATLENAMKRASSGKLKAGLIEILGPGGCYVLLDYETDNISTTRHTIKTICKKYGCCIAPGEGRWRAFYEQKGIIKVTRSNDGQPLSAEKALDTAIEAGAEDVQLKSSEEEETNFLEFYCDPLELFSVKKGLEERSYAIEESYVGYIANLTVEMSDEVMEAASGFLAELGEMSEVVRIYENVQ